MIIQPNSSMIKRGLLGEILIEYRIISDAQLSEALFIQTKKKSYIGDILFALGYVNEIDIVLGLGVQCGFPYIDIKKYLPQLKEVSMYIPKELARKHAMVALDKVGTILSLVMANPLDMALRENLADLTSCQIAPFIALKSEIINVIDQCYA